MCLIWDIVWGLEKDFPEQISSLSYKKKRNLKLSQEEEKEYNKIHSKKKENSDRAYHHLSIEKIQDNE